MEMKVVLEKIQAPVGNADETEEVLEIGKDYYCVWSSSKASHEEHRNSYDFGSASSSIGLPKYQFSPGPGPEMSPTQGTFENPTFARMNTKPSHTPKRKKKGTGKRRSWGKKKARTPLGVIRGKDMRTIIRYNNRKVVELAETDGGIENVPFFKGHNQANIPMKDEEGKMASPIYADIETELSLELPEELGFLQECEWPFSGDEEDLLDVDQVECARGQDVEVEPAVDLDCSSLPLFDDLSAEDMLADLLLNDVLNSTELNDVTPSIDSLEPSLLTSSTPPAMMSDFAEEELDDTSLSDLQRCISALALTPNSCTAAASTDLDSSEYLEVDPFDFA